MALKASKTQVRHYILTGGAIELDFYAADVLNRNPGFHIEKVMALVVPKVDSFSAETKLTLLYVLVKEGEGFVGPVESEPSEEKPKKNA